MPALLTGVTEWHNGRRSSEGSVAGVIYSLLSITDWRGQRRWGEAWVWK